MSKQNTSKHIVDPLHRRLRPKVYQQLIASNHRVLKENVISLKDFKRTVDMFDWLCEGTVQDECTNLKDDDGENVMKLYTTEFRAGQIHSTCLCSIYHNNSIMCRHVTLGYEKLNPDEKDSLDWLIYSRYFTSHDIETNLPVRDTIFDDSPSSSVPTSPEMPMDVSYPINVVQHNAYGFYEHHARFQVEIVNLDEPDVQNAPDPDLNRTGTFDDNGQSSSSDDGMTWNELQVQFREEDMENSNYENIQNQQQHHQNEIQTMQDSHQLEINIISAQLLQANSLIEQISSASNNHLANIP